MTTLKVGGVQYLHQEGRQAENIAAAVAMIRAHPGCRLYVLSELACSGYGPHAFAQLDRLAEPDDGPSYQAFAQLAREQNCYICYSFPRQNPNGKPFISADVVDPNGTRIATYDKWHICGIGDCSEADYFDMGQGPAAIFEVDGVKVGVAICYDLRFPEMMRTLTLDHQIDLLIHPGGWPRDECFSTWHTFTVTRAVENSIYIMSVNRAGDANGASIFCPPFVQFGVTPPRTLDPENAEGVLIHEVDPAEVRRIRASYTMLKDRRPDRYTAETTRPDAAN